MSVLPTPGTGSPEHLRENVDAALIELGEDDRLGFEVEMHPGPGFASLMRGDLRLLLNAPSGPGGAAQPMPDGRTPEPGGWNRIQLEVAELALLHEGLGRLAAGNSPSYPAAEDLSA